MKGVVGRMGKKTPIIPTLKENQPAMIYIYCINLFFIMQLLYRKKHIVEIKIIMLVIFAELRKPTVIKNKY